MDSEVIPGIISGIGRAWRLDGSRREDVTRPVLDAAFDTTFDAALDAALDAAFDAAFGPDVTRRARLDAPLEKLSNPPVGLHRDALDLSRYLILLCADVVDARGDSRDLLVELGLLAQARRFHGEPLGLLRLDAPFPVSHLV